MFWQEVPLDTNSKPKQGLWIVSRGSTVDRFDVEKEAFDIFTRYSNKIKGSKQLEDILDFLKDAYGDVCELPTVPPYSTTQYGNVRIRPTSSIEAVGFDEQNMLIRVISGEVQFNKL